MENVQDLEGGKRQNVSVHFHLQSNCADGQHRIHVVRCRTALAAHARLEDRSCVLSLCCQLPDHFLTLHSTTPKLHATAAAGSHL